MVAALAEHHRLYPIDRAYRGGRNDSTRIDPSLAATNVLGCRCPDWSGHEANLTHAPNGTTSHMPRIHLILTFAMSVCLVSGCSYRCFTNPYYRQPSIVGNAKSTLSWTKDTIFVDLDEGLSMGVSECDGSRRICVQFLIDAGHRLVVPDPVATIWNQSGKKVGAAIGYRSGRNDFSPDREAGPIEFVGGVDRPRTSIEKAMSKTMGWNKFRMTFEVEGEETSPTGVDEVYVQLPNMLLDTPTVPIPRFHFRRVIETHCQLRSFST